MPNRPDKDLVCFACGAKFGPRIAQADWPFPLCIFCWAEDQKHRSEHKRLAANLAKSLGERKEPAQGEL